MIAAVVSWFVLGSFMWWIFTLACVIWLFWTIETESFFWATANVIIYTLFLGFIAKVNIISAISEKPLLSLGMIVGYVVIGIGWSGVKWWLKGTKVAERLIEKRMSFLKGKDIKNVDKNMVVPDELKDEWKECKRRNSDLSRPDALQNRSKLVGWMMYWPISFIWSLLNDFIKSLYEKLVDKLNGFYQAISDKTFKNINEFEEEESD